MSDLDGFSSFGTYTGCSCWSTNNNVEGRGRATHRTEAITLDLTVKTLMKDANLTHMATESKLSHKAEDVVACGICVACETYGVDK